MRGECIQNDQSKEIWYSWPQVRCELKYDRNEAIAVQALQQGGCFVLDIFYLCSSKLIHQGEKCNEIKLIFKSGKPKGFWD